MLTFTSHINAEEMLASTDEGMLKKFFEQSPCPIDARRARSVRERHKMETYLREADPAETGTLLASFFNIPPESGLS